MFSTPGPRNAPVLRVLRWESPSVSRSRGIVRTSLNMTKCNSSHQSGPLPKIFVAARSVVK